MIGVIRLRPIFSKRNRAQELIGEVFKSPHSFHISTNPKLFNSQITCSLIPSLSITLASGYLQAEMVRVIRDLYLFLFSGSFKLMPRLRTVNCFLLAPLLEPSVGTKGVSQNHLLSFDDNKVLKIINWIC